ncbi:MAG: DegV family protein [Romboutsia sp.]|nr:DegV family protein [Romboutsia sp.]
MIKIICDSMSDVPDIIIEKYDVEIVPLTVIFNGVEYIDGVDINNKQFYKMLRESEVMPKTSQVTYSQFKEVFEKYKDDEVLYIGGSSAASGTYQSAVIAKNDGYENVHVFDTQNLSTGSALFVIKACEMREKGYSIEEIIENLNLLKGSEELIASVDTLEYLKKGGRISSTKAMIGNLLSIKPILTVENGLVSQKSQVRGKKHIYSELVKYMSDVYNKDLEDKTVILGCGDNEEDLETLKNHLTEECKVKDVYNVNIGCGICSHAGPGVLIISCI